MIRRLSCTADERVRALQPSLCAERGKINTGGRIPPACAIASAELLREFLIAIRNAQRRVASGFLRSRRRLSRSAISVNFAFP